MLAEPPSFVAPLPVGNRLRPQVRRQNVDAARQTILQTRLQQMEIGLWRSTRDGCLSPRGQCCRIPAARCSGTGTAHSLCPASGSGELPSRRQGNRCHQQLGPHAIRGQLCRSRISASADPLLVSIVHNGKRVVEHVRYYGKGHQILNLEHSLDALERKPGAMAGSTPLHQWRDAGRWPVCLDVF
jgi:hypothetical protein